MSISNKELYNKIKELVPSLTSNITPETLTFVCEDEEVQVFLKWFCENVSCQNILTEEETQITEHLKESGKWLEGEELDLQLEKATKDNHKLLELLEYSANIVQEEYKTEKEAYTADLDYCNLLENKFKKLKKIEHKLDDDLELEENVLEKEQVEVQIAYRYCNEVLEQFDSCSREFSSSVKQLLKIYADAAVKKGHPCTWTQMPLDLFIKQIESYSNSLEFYIKKQELNIKKQFEDSFISDNSVHNSSLSVQSYDDSGNEIAQQFFLCKTNLEKAKFEEISNKALENVWQSNLEYLKYIYNEGKDVKVPQNPEKLRIEIVELARKRDSLEEIVNILSSQQLNDMAMRFGQMELAKTRKEEARLKVERRKDRLAKLDHLRSLAREHGHAHSDLLCMLMENQHRLLTELCEFATEARHYLITEYSFSDKRCKFMQQVQDEYNKILSSFTNEQNAFNRLFMSMMENDNKTDVYNAIQKYDLLMAENKKRRETLLENECYSKFQDIKIAEKTFTTTYNAESDDGLTMSFKPVNFALKSKLEETTKKVQECESDVTTVRNKYKETFKNISESSLEREKNILWQMFLIAPDLLETKYEELEAKANQSHFKDSL